MYHIIQSSDIQNNVINLTQKMEGLCKLNAFIFTNNIYNVTTNNNILPYYESTLNNIELTTQYASGDDLATDIQTKIDAISAGSATVTYNANTCKLTIANTTNFSLKFGDNTTNTCHELIGFNQSNTDTVTTITSPNMLQLVSYKYITINIAQDCSLHVHNQTYQYDTFIIMGTSDFGDRMIYNSKDYTPQYMNLQPTKTLSVSFFDDKHNAINISNWALVFNEC